jgi:site-specific DNA recombinase
LSEGTHKSIDELAAARKLHPKLIRKGLRLAFLAPEITEAILFGHQPKSLNLSTLQQTLPLCWAEQRHALHFSHLA